MGTIFNKKIAAVQPTFAERLNATKSVFLQALNDAKTLKEDMVAEIKAKEARIFDLQQEIEDINAVGKDNDKFIKNLEGLV